MKYTRSIGPEFERPLAELNERIAIEKTSGGTQKEIDKLIKKRDLLIKSVYSSLTSYQRVQLARHHERPHTLDYIKGMFDDFVEFHGDRYFGDDKAIIGGIATFSGDTVVVIGHQKGRTIAENIDRNYGMPHPEGYRKALRLMKLAEKFGYPIITFVDTPGAYCGIKAEERGQAEAIARNLRDMMLLETPIIVVVIGEGGSGGALGIGVGDRILMLENAVYFVCTPEACSSILWRDSTMAEKAAEVLKLTAQDLLRLGVIDEIIEEPAGGAHWDYAAVFSSLEKRLIQNLGIMKRMTNDNLLKKRYKKFRDMGIYSHDKKSKKL